MIGPVVNRDKRANSEAANGKLGVGGQNAHIFVGGWVAGHGGQ